MVLWRESEVEVERMEVVAAEVVAMAEERAYVRGGG